MGAGGLAFYRELEQYSFRVRCDVVRMLTYAGSGHLGGSLSGADILTVLYGGGVLRVQPDAPCDALRDRCILSHGHVAPVLYAALAHRGFFPVDELQTLRVLGSRLQGHPSIHQGLPGLDSASGSLGQGLSVGVGFALAARLLQREYKTFVLLGDGELQEGQVWEAAMSATHHRLGNLVAIVDYNGLQIGGSTRDVMNLEPLADKWTSFGWGVHVVDGHDLVALHGLLSYVSNERHGDTPQVILARTTMGCGIASIEHDSKWHGRVPNAEEEKGFLAELAEFHEKRMAHIEAQCMNACTCDEEGQA